MSGYNVDFRLEDSVLYVRLSGQFPKELLHRPGNVFQPLIDACSTHNCNRALIDARDLKADFDTRDLLRAGLDALSLSGVGLRTALLAREDMLDRFFENVVYNRGGQVGIFTDMDGARDWLERW
jgi:hypothetical protein